MKLPIGYDNFGEVANIWDFVDKSLFIQEVLYDPAKVVVIIRPRRFGKTFNLSMLHHFLAPRVFGLETKDLFQTLKIADNSEVMTHQGKYPVIFLTLKEIKASNFESAYADLSKLMSCVYHDHIYLLESDKLSSYQKKIIESILAEKAEVSSIKSSLLDLTRYISLHHGIKPWLLMDEYDTPIQASYLHGYYDQMIELMRGLLGSVLKTNPYLYKAVMTGILRIAKESLFSGLNNVDVYSLFREEYSQHFGFTEPEVEYLLKETQLSHQADAIKRWYNGYQMGSTVMYNPWSIVNCIKQKGALKPYWVNTSDNQLIRDLLVKSSVQFKEKFEDLLQGQSIQRVINENFVFSALLHTNETAAWSLLIMAGYLKVESQQYTDDGLLCQLAIPNHEIRNLYQQIIKLWLGNGYGIEWTNQLLDYLLMGNLHAFEGDLKHVMEQTISHHDTGQQPEAFYHGLMIGLTASLFYHPNYTLLSNRESGYGRYDYLIFSQDPHKLTLLLEFKKVEWIKQTEKLTERLEISAQEALDQIIQQGYLAEAKQRGCVHMMIIGLAFCGKRFNLASKKVDLS